MKRENIINVNNVEMILDKIPNGEDMAKIFMKAGRVPLYCKVDPRHNRSNK